MHTKHSMKTFGPVFNRWMDNSPHNQSSLAALVKISQSNLSRIARGIILPEADTLEAILRQVPDKSDKLNLVQAYINDALGDEAKELARDLPVGVLNDHIAITSTLTPRGHRALNFLLTLRTTVPAVEDMFIDIAKAIGWTDQPTSYPTTRHSLQLNEEPARKEKTFPKPRPPS